ncbi:MAG: hypothetical protein WD768_21955 [Phycisphaeraceae bacterium]
MTDQQDQRDKQRIPTQQTESAGMVGQVSRLKQHTGASIGELRAFMHEMRGKSPKEMLGVLAQSELVRATALATVGAAVLLVIFTLLPMLFGGDKAKPAAVQPAANLPVTPPAGPVKAAAKTEDDKKAKSSKEDVAKKLGIDETKTIDPKKNPLDDLGGDLFKDIK